MKSNLHPKRSSVVSEFSPPNFGVEELRAHHRKLCLRHDSCFEKEPPPEDSMGLENGYGELGASYTKGLGQVKVLLTESDGLTRAAAKAVLENMGIGVISARSAARALDLCNAPHLRFDVLVLGPSLLDPGLDMSLKRVLSLQPGLRVLALTAGNRDPAAGSRMTPLAVCWALERIGCEYSLLDDPWTGPRLLQCLQELLARSCEPVAYEHASQGAEDDRFPGGTQRPSRMRTRVKL